MALKKKKETKDVLQNMLEDLVNEVKKVKNFTLEHAPDVCKEIVKVKAMGYYHDAVQEILVGIMILIPSTILFITAYCVRNNKCEIGLVLSLVFGIVGLIVVGCFFIDAIRNFLYVREINASPKLTILKELKYLIGR